LTHAASWPQQIWPKLGIYPFGGGELARAEAYLHAKFHLDPFNHLATVQQRYRQRDKQDRQTDKQRSDSIGRTVSGRPFVKRFALHYQTVVCPVCLGPNNIVLDGDPARPKRGSASPQFLAHVYCAKTVAHLS